MIHGSEMNTSERPRRFLLFALAAADAWPLLGSGSYMKFAGNQQGLCDALAEQVVTGSLSFVPRVAPCPVRLPLPPAPDAGSIFKTQKTGGARSVFA